MTYRLNLQVFEGPFDLLLYLIKKNEIDIYDIPIARILDEYLQYVEMMKELDLDVAGDFILMGATLMHIKSRMLLPQESLALEDGGELDPRAELVRQLLEYKRFKSVAGQLEHREAHQRDVFGRLAGAPPEDEEKSAEAEEPQFLEVNLFDLLTAFKQVLAFAKPETFRELNREEFKTSQKINELLDRLEQTPTIDFADFLKEQPTRIAMVTAFLAVLELTRLKAVRLTQEAIFGPIRIERVDEFTATMRESMVASEE